MNNSEALSIFATTISAMIFPFIKMTVDRRLNILNNKHKKYQFIKEFINDLNKVDAIHPLVIQHGASILFGGYLEKEHVDHLLKLRIETPILLNYSSIRTFIEYNIICSKIIYRKKYRKSYKRKIEKIKHLVSYSFSVVFPVVVYIYFPVFSSGVSKAIAFIVISLLSFALAYLSLILYFSLRDAEAVVEASKKISNLY